MINCENCNNCIVVNSKGKINCLGGYKPASIRINKVTKEATYNKKDCKGYVKC